MKHRLLLTVLLLLTLTATTAIAPAPKPSVGSEVTPKPKPKPKPNYEKKFDADYLNSNTVWIRSELKTSLYQGLYDAFTRGDIEAIADHEYFASKGVAKNIYSIKIIERLWKAKGTLWDRIMRKCLRSFDYSKGLNLKEMNDVLARYAPPQEKENKSPRPQH